MRPSLLIVRAGKNSTHGLWIADARNFDLLVLAYEALPPALTEGAEEHVLIPGTKVASWHQLFIQRPDLLTRYAHIALLDDDLICSTADIDACFALGQRYKLALWQPSLSWDSYFSYGITLHNPQFQLRYVNYVEMMCPFFSVDHLTRAMPLFALGDMGFIDRLWCRTRPDWHKAYAVIDQVQVRHSRPVGKNAAAQGFSRDPRRRDDNMYQLFIDKAEAETGIVFKGPVAYAGITKGGREIDLRLSMALMALHVLRGARVKVDSRFYRPITDHVRHILTRPLDNTPIDVAAIVEKQIHKTG